MDNQPDRQSTEVSEEDRLTPGGWRLHYGRNLVILAVVLLVISTIFPIAASLTPPEELPGWAGILDVVLAFGLAILLLVLYGLGQPSVGDPDRLASYRIYRWLASLLVVGLILFFVAGSRIRWDVLLPGLAWRIWLLVYVLPALLALWILGKPSR